MPPPSTPPLEAIYANLYPQSDGEITFPATAGGSLIFKITEEKASRLVGTNSKLVYNVSLDPPKEDLFTAYLDYSSYDPALGNRILALSDEVIIGWNIFDWVGWTFFDLSLVKRWPPVCTRMQNNAYRVEISYAPLNVINFQIISTKTKRLYALETEAYAWNGLSQDYMQVTIGNLPDGASNEEGKLALLAINTDEKGKIQGVDVEEPAFTWTERWNWGPNDIFGKPEDPESEHPEEDYESYMITLAGLAATVNKEKFRQLPVGSVLFHNATGRSAGPMRWEIDYKFTYKPPKPFTDLGGKQLEIPSSLGSSWVHVDVMAFEAGRKVKINDRLFVLKFPEMVKMHKLYELEDWTPMYIHPTIGLGIGRFLAYTSEVPHQWLYERCLVTSPDIT